MKKRWGKEIGGWRKGLLLDHHLYTKGAADQENYTEREKDRERVKKRGGQEGGGLSQKGSK